MSNFKNKIEDFNKTNLAEILYEFGITPDEVKQLIIEEFQGYFQNKKNLETYVTMNLTTLWFSFLTIQRDYKETLLYIEKILEIYNSAKVIDKELTLNAYAIWLSDFSQSITRFWSIYYGQKKYDDLCDEDYLSEIIQLIGQSIEGVSKPFFQFTLYLNRIKRKKHVEIEEIKNKDLGLIIDELITTSDLKDALIVNNIRLNQWRNISYHHNTKIVNGKMFYYLKRKGAIETFEITRGNLKFVVKLILNFIKILRIAENIFYIDNIDDIQEKIKSIDTSQVNVRKESELIDFNYSINSQGFKLLNLEYDGDVATLNLIDLEAYSDIEKKAIHSSQFLYNLWLLTKSKHLKINYYLFNNTLFFTSEILSKYFIENIDDDIPIRELLKNVEFTYINTDIKQNLDPFHNLNFAEKILRNVPQFYSQK